MPFSVIPFKVGMTRLEYLVVFVANGLIQLNNDSLKVPSLGNSDEGI
ncbi:MAG: hypothetical protein RLZZ380_160 [Actinomycetota bacterium]|jgi:hypothetical protein